ncbi:MAG TPA: ArsR family transcriptional regulator [Saprospiraceae bacterium]|nr:ArsR family transcriptional regulator [Saprospiraceae bacterium]
MGASKLDLFDDKTVLFSGYAKCLAHPARVEIIKYLSLNGVSTLKEFIQITGLSQPSVSQHLQILDKHQMLLITVDYNCNIYSLNPATVSNMKVSHDQFFDQFNFPKLR